MLGILARLNLYGSAVVVWRTRNNHEISPGAVHLPPDKLPDRTESADDR
jgi:hypothetical protein